MKRLISFILLAYFMFSACGCAPLIIGVAAGGIGAYAISKDTVQGDSDKDYDALWDSALNIVQARGLVQKEDFSNGSLEAGIQSSKVWIKLIRLTKATTRVKVSARKYRLPNIELAQDVFVKIINGVK